MSKRYTISLAFAATLASTGMSLAAGDDNRPAAGVQDNSFLIEEAYNQEAGVVQHINSWRRQGRDWNYMFTQEWPIRTENHQFSYSVPYIWLRGDGVRSQGVGDIFLNYRFQALKETSSQPAFAPRASLILPTGDAGKGTGNDSVGYQFNLPLSKIVSDRLTLHFNAGHTAFVDVEGHRPRSYNLGGSVVYALNRTTNLMLESTIEWNQQVASGLLERERVVTLSPGIRHAFNLAGDAQLVLGLAMPVTFKPEKTDYGVLMYLSYEHSFLK
ncbi:MAG: transporter [Hyphomicrobiaceae bacterium]